MLENIIWNKLYASKISKRVFAEARIQAHYIRMKLSRRGVIKAVVRYEFSIFLHCAFNAERFCRPTGFHGESGGAKSGGHIVVDFRSKDRHVVTHHIYPTDEAYRWRGRSVWTICWLPYINNFLDRTVLHLKHSNLTLISSSFVDYSIILNWNVFTIAKAVVCSLDAEDVNK